MEVAVVGGGLAGVAAACSLAERGARVTLLEQRPFVGGRVYSFRDRVTGDECDNGQHVFLGCCTEFLAFLRRLGVEDRVFLQGRMRATYLLPGGEESTLAAWPFPAPFHILGPFLRLGHLSMGDKIGILRGLRRIRKIGPEERRALDSRTFQSWLEEHGQTPTAISRFWNHFVVSTLNEEASRVSAALAIQVYQDGLMRGSTDANIGFARVGLSSVFAEAAQRYVEARGGTFRFGERVVDVRVEGDRVAGLRMASGRAVAAEAYVVALPFHEVPRVLPEPWRSSDPFRHAAALAPSPILNVHLWLDRDVLEHEFVGLLDGPLHWVFNKSRILRGSGGSYLSVTISAAREWSALSQEEVVRRTLEELRRYLPAAREAQVRHSVVVKESAATFSAVPGTAALRPTARTPIANLFLAGAWTDTGWPATMEGAVRSGVAAARAVLG